jgi:hypothetical protein
VAAIAGSLDDHVEPADLAVVGHHEPRHVGPLAILEEERAGDAPVAVRQIPTLQFALTIDLARDQRTEPPAASGTKS